MCAQSGPERHVDVSTCRRAVVCRLVSPEDCDCMRNVEVVEFTNKTKEPFGFPRYGPRALRLQKAFVGNHVRAFAVQLLVVALLSSGSRRAVVVPS